MTTEQYEEMKKEYQELAASIHEGMTDGEADAITDALEDLAAELRAYGPEEENDKYFDDLPENQMVFVNAYAVTRHYGGPEEDGWWYNWYECLEVFPARNNADSLDAIVTFLEENHKDEAYGNIYSVLGGQEVTILVERAPKESESKERPRYE